jgi:hypothetical protein
MMNSGSPRAKDPLHRLAPYRPDARIEIGRVRHYRHLGVLASQKDDRLELGRDDTYSSGRSKRCVHFQRSGLAAAAYRKQKI